MAGWPTPVCRSRAPAASGSPAVAVEQIDEVVTVDRRRRCRAHSSIAAAKTGSVAVQARAHARVLRALAGEEERDLGAGHGAGARRGRPWIGAAQQARRRTAASCATIARRCGIRDRPTDERVRHVREVESPDARSR